MNILQLTTYPLSDPMHGGQIRASEISKKLRSLGHIVLSVSVSEPTHTRFNQENDLIISPSSLSDPFRLPFCTDLLCAKASIDGPIFKFLSKKFESFCPELIIIEQAWLWPAVRKLLKVEKRHRDKTRIIYSSHNVEYTTKESILLSHGYSHEIISKAINEIFCIERDLIHEADATICVTQADIDHYKSVFGNHVFFLAPNGVTKRAQPSESAIQHVRHYVNNRPFLFFVGSAYPPNAFGFWEAMGPTLSYMPPDRLIVAAGGVGTILEQYTPPDFRYCIDVNRLILRTPGLISHEHLSAFFAECKGIILPISNGGGSNLKTAEAITSGKPTVATGVACRGFDFINELSNFYVASNPTEFKLHCQLIVNRNLQEFSQSERERTLRDSVQWENTLSILEKLVSHLELNKVLTN